MTWRTARTALAALVVICLPLVDVAPANAAAAPKVGALTVEHQTDPLGVDVVRPRLGWTLSTGAQSAYQIAVSRTPAGPADVWDSGRVTSAQSFDVDYVGPALASRARYFWRVRVWTGGRTASRWSAPARFETAFVHPGEFQGQWIGARRALPQLSLGGANWIWYPDGDPASSAPAGVRYLRRAFDLPAGEPTGRAELQITADDAFTVFVNGAEVARSPAVANSWSTASIVDVSSVVRPGANLIAVEAVNTSAGPAGLLAELAVEGSGRRFELATDETWKAADAAGAGWERPGFDDSAWPAARVAATYGMVPGVARFPRRRPRRRCCAMSSRSRSRSPRPAPTSPASATTSCSSTAGGSATTSWIPGSRSTTRPSSTAPTT